MTTSCTCKVTVGVEPFFMTGIERAADCPEHGELEITRAPLAAHEIAEREHPLDALRLLDARCEEPNK